MATKTKHQERQKSGTVKGARKTLSPYAQKYSVGPTTTPSKAGAKKAKPKSQDTKKKYKKKKK